MDSMIDCISLHFTYVCAVRHYEVVYLIHEKHAEEVESINEKVQGEICFPSHGPLFLYAPTRYHARPMNRIPNLIYTRVFSYSGSETCM